MAVLDRCSFVIVLLLAGPLGLAAQTTPTSGAPRAIWRVGDTISVEIPKGMKEKSPAPDIAKQFPDTMRLLLVGDSAVSLNLPVKLYYSKARVDLYKMLLDLRALVDTAAKR